jgi:hypothetical protein
MVIIATYSYKEMILAAGEVNKGRLIIEKI